MINRNSIVISRALAQDLFDLLNQTIEYDTDGEPINSDHAALLDNMLDLEFMIKQG